MIKARELFPEYVQNVYLASPFFNPAELEVYGAMIDYLRNAGYNVYVPQEHEIEGGKEMENSLWGKMVFAEDWFAIDDCDAMLVINWGLYSDSGTAWEQGYAMGRNKWVVSVLVEIDTCKHPEVSLMMANGCDKCVALSDLVDLEGFNLPLSRWEQK